jgi:anti-sigma B factor antagonist
MRLGARRAEAKHRRKCHVSAPSGARPSPEPGQGTRVGGAGPQTDRERSVLGSTSNDWTEARCVARVVPRTLLPPPGRAAPWVPSVASHGECVRVEPVPTSPPGRRFLIRLQLAGRTLTDRRRSQLRDVPRPSGGTAAVGLEDALIDCPDSRRGTGRSRLLPGPDPRSRSVRFLTPTLGPQFHRRAGAGHRKGVAMGSVPPFTARIERHADVAVVALGGELDLATAPNLSDRLAQLEPEGVAAIMLDLRKLSFVDASGLRVFLDAWTRAKATGHRFNMAMATSRVRSFLGTHRHAVPPRRPGEHRDLGPVRQNQSP